MAVATVLQVPLTAVMELMVLAVVAAEVATALPLMQAVTAVQASSLFATTKQVVS